MELGSKKLTREDNKEQNGLSTQTSRTGCSASKTTAVHHEPKMSGPYNFLICALLQPKYAMAIHFWRGGQMVIVPSTWPLLYRIGSHDSFALHTIACFCFRGGAGFVEWKVPKIAVWAGEGRITCTGMCARRKLACACGPGKSQMV